MAGKTQKYYPSFLQFDAEFVEAGAEFFAKNAVFTIPNKEISANAKDV